MAALARTLVYASLFIGLLLVFLPARILAWSGVTAPASFGAWQVAGLVLGGAGALLALACVLTFALVGKGTPAPFDPPRRLVCAGPYRWVRNPMYLGAGLALLGALLYYGSVLLGAYLLLFLLCTGAFVHWYEEPTLWRTFGSAYEAYCAATPRWVPRLRARQQPPP